MAPNHFGVRFSRYLMGRYSGGERVLGELWLGAQRDYWSKEERTDVLGAPRIYLGILQLFGDPSLRIRP